MPYISPEERERWRAANADLIEYIAVPANQRASRFIASMHAAFEQYGSLTEPQTSAARNVMRELTEGTGSDDSNAPALADDAVHILNGTYTINDGSQHLTFQVYTVRRGALQGKRIIKRQLQYSEFKGFAFLTRSGGIKVWRSHYEDEARNERYIVWARILVAALNENGRDGHSTESEYEFTYAQDSGYQIQASVVCRRCNRALTDPTSISIGIGPECRNLEQTARTTAAPAHEQVAAPTMAQVAESDRQAREAEQVVRIINTPIGHHEQMLMDRIDRARREMYAYGPYGHQACEHCGRNDFQSAQGRGRHISVCRRTNPRNLHARAVITLGEYRVREGITRDDDYARSYDRLIINTPSLSAIRDRVAAARPVRQPVAARRSYAGATAGSPRTPNLSALGTVFGGQVWEQ